jgi:5-methylcytosine-specific restriction endonuclease McrA
MAYRCQGCRQYKRGAPFDRMGLGSVCSPACAGEAIDRTRKRPRASAPPADIPASTRTIVLSRDGGCRYCGVRVGLHVHHIAYRSEGVDHSETNLIALCARHHDLMHSDKGYWQPVLQAYIADLYNNGRKSYLRDVARRLDQARPPEP